MPSTDKKGRLYVNEVVKILIRMGCTCETAVKKAVWVRNKKTGKMMVITLAHDFFGCWDIIYKLPDGRTGWAQVTTIDNLSSHKQKVRKFHSSKLHDVTGIWCRIGGRPVSYRIYYGSEDYEWTGHLERVNV